MNHIWRGLKKCSVDWGKWDGPEVRGSSGSSQEGGPLQGTKGMAAHLPSPLQGPDASFQTPPQEWWPELALGM